MNKNINKLLFVLVLFSIVILSISMVNAADVSNDTSNLNSIQHNLEIDNSTSITSFNSTNMVNNVKANLDNNNQNSEKTNISITKVKENSAIKNSSGNINKNDNDLFKITKIKATTHDAIYDFKIDKNKNITIYYYINNTEDVDRVSKIIFNNDKYNENLIFLDFEKNKEFKVSPKVLNIFNPRFKYLVIRGNGAKIISEPVSVYSGFSDPGDLSSPSEIDGHFLYLCKNQSCYISNITISNFKIAIINEGNLNIQNSVLSNNYAGSGYGGTIFNRASMKIINSTFSGNKANYGGAIYNEKGSHSIFLNCKFSKNSAYQDYLNKKSFKNIIKKFFGSEVSNLISNDENNIHSSEGALCIVKSSLNNNFVFNIKSITDLFKASILLIRILINLILLL